MNSISNNSNNKFDLAVIGGGPAGMMAAGQAAELGARVVLLEKNNQLGTKLLITGKGKCNLTNAEESLRRFLESYGKSKNFFRPALYNFSNQDVVSFFEKRGVKTKVERGGRIFPISDRAKDVLSCLERYLKKSDAEIKFNSSVRRIVAKTNNNGTKKIERLILKNGKSIFAENFVIATGGKSYPKTGSTGDGYRWAEQLGHTLVEPKPALTPIATKEKWVKKLEGLSLKNVEVSLWNSSKNKQNKKLASFFGEALFISEGLSGPTVLNLSKKISESDEKDLKIKIDFKPGLDHQKLDKRIQRDFLEYKNKQFKNSLEKLLPKKLIPTIIWRSEIEPEKKVNKISKIERKKIVKLLKEFELEVKELVGFEKAIITSGGVKLSEVESKTMKSRIVNNLYFAGEVLDIDGPTGGFNLQVAWSTGFLAGESAYHKK